MELKRKPLGPLPILLAAALGVCFGIFFPDLIERVEGVEAVLSNLLKMCVIPIVVSSLVVEIVSFIKSSKPGNIKKFIFLSLLVSVFFAGIATFSSVVLHPGKSTTFPPNSSITKNIAESSMIERGVRDPIEEEVSSDFFEFLSTIVPHNIFLSLNESKTLQIIFFAVVFAIALAHIPESEPLIEVFRATRHSFLHIFEYGLRFLPILIFSTSSIAIAKVGVEVFLDMKFFLMTIFLQLGVIFVINLGLLRYLLQGSIWSILKKLQSSIIVAFSGSPLAATLPAMDFFNKEGHKDKQMVAVLTPISMFINRFSTILYFCAATLFIGHLYGHTFTFGDRLLLVLLSIIGGIASCAGSEGIRYAVLVSILDRLRIPASQSVLILGSLDFLLAPFLSMVTVQTNITLLSFLLPRSKKLVDKSK